MKKLYGVLLALSLISLTGCMQKECNPLTKEVVRTVEKIKEVEVPVIVEKYIEVPYYKDTEFRYKPGSYYKTKEADGFTYMVHLNVNKTGLIDNLFIDKTSNETLLYQDEETNKLYVKVKGIKDVIPNSYRLVSENKLPSIKDAIMVDDLIEGYPAHEAIIKSLKPININNTRRTNALIFNDDWANQMDLVIEKILNDQTTSAIHLYNAATGTKTDNIPGVSINIGHEIDLLNSLLLNEASLPDGYDLDENIIKDQGLYKPGYYFNISTPIIDGSSLKYSTSLVFVDFGGNITDVFLDEFTSDERSKRINGTDKEWLTKVDKIQNQIVLNQNTVGMEYYDLDGEVTDLDFKIVNHAYAKEAYLNGIKMNALMEAMFKSLEDAFNNFDLRPGNYYYRTKEGYIYSTVTRYVATEDKDSYKKGDIITDSNDLKTIKNKLKILGLTIDRVLQDEEAKYLKNGKEVEIFTYKKAYPVYSKASDFEEVAIYKESGKDTYYYLDSDSSLEMTKDTKVKFSNKYFDEASTITKQNGFKTVQTTINPSDEIKQERALFKEISKEVVKKDSLLGLVLKEDKTIEGFESKLDASKIVADLRRVQMVASNSVNSASNVITPDINITNKKLGSGSFYSLDGKDDFSNYGQMMVYNNQVVGILIDKLEYNEKHDLNIFNSQVNDNLYDLGANLSHLKFDADDLVYDYDYSPKAKLNFNTKISLTPELEEYDYVFKKLLEESLAARVYETFENAKKYLEETTKDQFILPSNNLNSGMVLAKDELEEALVVGKVNGVDKKLEVKFDLAKGLVEKKNTSGDTIFIYDKDLDQDTTLDINYELRLDKNKVEGVIKAPIYTISSIQKWILNYTKDGESNLSNILGTHEAVLENTKVKFSLLASLDKYLAMINDANLSKYYLLLDLDNVEAYNGGITYQNKAIIEGPKELSFRLVDNKKAGNVNVKIFMDLKNEDAKYKTYEKGEHYLDVEFEVLSQEMVKKEIKTATSLDGIINNVTSEKPIKLESSDSFRVMGVEVSYKHKVNGMDKVSHTGLVNDNFGFIDLKDETKKVSDTYEPGDYYQVDLPISGSVKVVLEVTYKDANDNSLLKTYDFSFTVKRGDTREVEEVIAKSIKSRIREVSNAYPNLEYRYIEKEDAHKLYYNGLHLEDIRLNTFNSFDIDNPLDKTSIQITIDWLNDRDVHIANTDMSFEEIILTSLKGNYPKEEEIKKTKIVARCQYKVDDISIVSYVDFNFNIYNNGITTE